jgi:UPF0716 family protein affecting phage T7 exclusion
MDAASVSPHRSRATSLYYGWIVLLVAAAAMVGTLPGRTQGLGWISRVQHRDERRLHACLSAGRQSRSRVGMARRMAGGGV